MVDLLEFRGGGTPGILNVEEKERVIKPVSFGLGSLVHFGSGNALVEQGFEPVKGIATGNQLSQELFQSTIRGIGAKCKIRKRLQNHALEKASRMA
jgi:hypothetical protein